MSKAFTKEDDDGGVTLPASSSFVVPNGRFHVTASGAILLEKKQDTRIREILARADILPATPARPDRAMLGVRVTVRVAPGGAAPNRAVAGGSETKSYKLVTSEERGLTAEGCSVHSPLGRALLGKEVGDICEVATPRGNEELEVIALEGETAA